MRNTLLLFLLSFYSFVFFGCKRETLMADQESTKIADSRIWFENYLASNEVNAMFKGIKYHWSKAKTFTFKNGYKAITVPITETKLHNGYRGKRILYLYPWKNGKGYYSSIFELIPDREHLQLNNGDINLSTFSGYISTWDLKKGFSRGAKFNNGQPIKNISIEFKKTISNNLSTNKIQSTSIKKEAHAGPPTVTDITPAPLAGWGFYWITLMNNLGYSTFYLWDGGSNENPCEYTGCSYSENPEDYFDKDIINIITQELYDAQWVDESIIDSTNNPCVAAALSTLTSISSKLPKLIRNFFGNDASFTMNLKYENLNSLAGGETPSNITSDTLLVRINSLYNKATDLALASTIIHEAFHCQLLSWYRIALNQNDTAMKRQLAEEYGYLFSEETISVDSTLRYIVNQGQAAQHQDFVNRYIGLIADALYEFAQAKQISGITLDYCKDLAWAGTFDSNAFLALDQTTRVRILDRVNAEKDPDGSKQVNENYSTPKGHICP